jgi:hypothetical protein
MKKKKEKKNEDEKSNIHRVGNDNRLIKPTQPRQHIHKQETKHNTKTTASDFLRQPLRCSGVCTKLGRLQQSRVLRRLLLQQGAA